MSECGDVDMIIRESMGVRMYGCENVMDVMDMRMCEYMDVWIHI